MTDPRIEDTNHRFSRCHAAFARLPGDYSEDEFRWAAFTFFGGPYQSIPTTAEFLEAGMRAESALWRLTGPEFLWHCIYWDIDPADAPITAWYACSEDEKAWYSARVAESWHPDVP